MSRSIHSTSRRSENTGGHILQAERLRLTTRPDSHPSQNSSFIGHSSAGQAINRAVGGRIISLGLFEPPLSSIVVLNIKYFCPGVDSRRFPGSRGDHSHDYSST
ncbi:hypothetical protein CDAR_619121 [Caerostris darwini]|uniref:Uncharacterized protein n=1 Tax=Caerostris darwini TaxID=1538125 RepID=A0AAV4U2P1_9ARAC|nr:hypothetical protein CDAR_619121 [Caerostris darwini]